MMRWLTIHSADWMGWLSALDYFCHQISRWFLLTAFDRLLYMPIWCLCVIRIWNEHQMRDVVALCFYRISALWFISFVIVNAIVHQEYQKRKMTNHFNFARIWRIHNSCTGFGSYVACSMQMFHCHCFASRPLLATIYYYYLSPIVLHTRRLNDCAG